MTPRIAVDTHALVWFFAGDARLSAKARAMMDADDLELLVPVIGLAEACWLIDRGKSSIPSAAALLAAMDDDGRFNVVPMDRAILERANLLATIPEMHDRLIIATVLELQGFGETIPLVTKDSIICASGLIATIW